MNYYFYFFLVEFNIGDDEFIFGFIYGDIFESLL